MGQLGRFQKKGRAYSLVVDAEQMVGEKYTALAFMTNGRSASELLAQIVGSGLLRLPLPTPSDRCETSNSLY